MSELRVGRYYFTPLRDGDPGVERCRYCGHLKLRSERMCSVCALRRTKPKKEEA